MIELCADKGNAPLVGGIAMFIEVGGIGIAIAIAGCCPGCPTPGGCGIEPGWTRGTGGCANGGGCGACGG